MRFTSLTTGSRRGLIAALGLLACMSCALASPPVSPGTGSPCDSGAAGPRGEGEGRPLVIAYYFGDGAAIDRYPVEKLTHIIFSFLHLEGDCLALRDSVDTLSIARVVSMKRRNPALKVLLSLGGWGGCSTCSAVFSTPGGRRAFAESAKEILRRFGADGIDLDWEYPAIQGYPEHPFTPGDRHNFTLLVQELRSVLGPGSEVSFAAGGFLDYLRNSIEWSQVMPAVDRVNVMTYDYVNGDSPRTGHLTPLYSTAGQEGSTDHAVRFLDSVGVPRAKIVIGAAFYARVWEKVGVTNHGLYQSGRFLAYVEHKDFARFLRDNGGFQDFWDSTAQAPFTYNARRGLFATFDDERSLALKTVYFLRQHLGGIMFWELGSDLSEHGLLGSIDDARRAELSR